MPDKKIVIEFSGPFSWHGTPDPPSIFDSDISKKSGIYLWTVSHNGGELVYYVGETGRDFATRMMEHFKEHCSGGYHFYSPEKFRRGIKEQLWPGRYDASERKSIRDFIDIAHELWPAILELIGIYRFFCAPLEVDRRIRRRIEAGIAGYLYMQDGIIGSFQDRGIQYQPRTDREAPIFVEIHPWKIFQGLPSTLEV